MWPRGEPGTCDDFPEAKYLNGRAIPRHRVGTQLSVVLNEMINNCIRAAHVSKLWWESAKSHYMCEAKHKMWSGLFCGGTAERGSGTVYTYPIVINFTVKIFLLHSCLFKATQLLLDYFFQVSGSPMHVSALLNIIRTTAVWTVLASYSVKITGRIP